MPGLPGLRVLVFVGSNVDSSVCPSKPDHALILAKILAMPSLEPTQQILLACICNQTYYVSGRTISLEAPKAF